MEPAASSGRRVTNAKVIDASAVAAIVFGEPEGDAVLEAIGEARLAAPTLLRYELANIAWKAARRGTDGGGCREALRLALSLDIERALARHAARDARRAPDGWRRREAEAMSPRAWKSPVCRRLQPSLGTTLSGGGDSFNRKLQHRGLSVGCGMRFSSSLII